MTKIYITKGLPASGKSTYAKALVSGSEGAVKRVNKDDLRAMVDNGKWSKENEKLIIAARDALIETYVNNSCDVIVDDTNLNPEMEKGLRRKFGQANEIVVLDEFLQVDVDECVRRDRLRNASVGEKVIRDMWKNWENKWITIDCSVSYEKPLAADFFIPAVGTPDSVIVDIDGTLAHHVGRSPYDFSKVHTDRVDPVVRDLVNHYARHGFTILVVSGRDDKCYDDTFKWLQNNHITFDHLIMRKTGDRRKDSIVKKEIFDNQIREKYNVHFVLDDRDQVVDMWRNVLGLKCLQVAEGAF